MFADDLDEGVEEPAKKPEPKQVGRPKQSRMPAVQKDWASRSEPQW